MENVKRKFLIFLDIDGVLNGIDCCGDDQLKPESISALNNLIKRLEENFDTMLIISSTLKADMSYVDYLLRSNGLDYNKRLFSTIDGNVGCPKWTEIKATLEMHWYMREFKDCEYVIIDDQDFSGEDRYDAGRIIKTDFYQGGLSQQHVDKFLENLPNLQPFEGFEF